MTDPVERRHGDVGPPAGTIGRRRTDPGVDDPAPFGDAVDAVKVSMPAWVSPVVKSGAWALLAFWLTYAWVAQRAGQMQQMSAEISATNAAVAQVARKMDDANQAMHAYVIDTQRTNDRSRLLLLEVCVQQAEMLKVAGGTQRCFNAANGIAPPAVGP